MNCILHTVTVKCSKILNTFSCRFKIKCCSLLDIRARNHKCFVRIANREAKTNSADPDQTASEEAV